MCCPFSWDTLSTSLDTGIGLICRRPLHFVHLEPAHASTLTHHSLGAAIASLCTLDLRQQHPNVKMALYTFGQPRVGNRVSSETKMETTFAPALLKKAQLLPPDVKPRTFTNFSPASTVILTGASLTTATLCRICRSCVLGSGKPFHQPLLSREYCSDFTVRPAYPLLFPIRSMGFHHIPTEVRN